MHKPAGLVKTGTHGFLPGTGDLCGASYPDCISIRTRPASSVEYNSAPDQKGNRLILGYSTFQAFATLRALPSPADGQQFSDLSIELAPDQFFSNVYVPHPGGARR